MAVVSDVSTQSPDTGEEGKAQASELSHEEEQVLLACLRAMWCHSDFDETRLAFDDELSVSRQETFRLLDKLILMGLVTSWSMMIYHRDLERDPRIRPVRRYKLTPMGWEEVRRLSRIIQEAEYADSN